MSWLKLVEGVHLKSDSNILLHTQSELQRPNSRWIVAIKRPCAANYS